MSVDVQIWAGLPDGEILTAFEVSDVPLPSTSPDVSTVFNDLITHLFAGEEPAGAYVLGLRIKERGSSAIMAQSIVGFRFAP